MLGRDLSRYGRKVLPCWMSFQAFLSLLMIWLVVRSLERAPGILSLAISRRICLVPMLGQRRFLRTLCQSCWVSHEGVHLAGEWNSPCSLFPYQFSCLLSQLASKEGEMLVEGIGQVLVPFLDCLPQFLDLVWDSLLHTNQNVIRN